MGNCVLARYSATPDLKPSITVSEMKLTTTPARTNQASKATVATRKAVQLASAVNRVGSPPAMSPSEEPIKSEMADVTLMTVCFELQKNQKTNPENRHA